MIRVTSSRTALCSTGQAPVHATLGSILVQAAGDVSCGLAVIQSSMAVACIIRLVRSPAHSAVGWEPQMNFKGLRR